MAALPLSCQQEMLFLNVPIHSMCREQTDPEEQMGVQNTDNFPSHHRETVVNSHQDHQLSMHSVKKNVSYCALS